MNLEERKACLAFLFGQSKLCTPALTLINYSQAIPADLGIVALCREKASPVTIIKM